MILRDIHVGTFLTGRSLFRESKTLLLMSIFILILVYVNLIFIPNLIAGLVDTILGKLQDTTVAQIQVEPERNNNSLFESEQLIADIEKLPGVSKATAITTIPAELVYHNNATSFGTLLVDPESFLDTFKLRQYLIEGDFFTEQDANQIVIGAEVAGRGQFDAIRGALFEIQVGDSLDLSVGGQIDTFEVVGIYDADFAQADSNSYIRRHDFENSGFHWDDSPQKINVAVPNQADLDGVIDDIKSLDYPIKVASWEEIGGVLDDTVESFNIMGRIIQLVSLIIGAITVFIVTYVDLTNKQKQIGIERAIGITDQAIFLNFVLRGLAIAIIAIVLGVLSYLYAIVPIEHAHPFVFPFGQAKLIVDLPYMLTMSGLLLSVVLISSAIPTIRILKQPILKSIWG